MTAVRRVATPLALVLFCSGAIAGLANGEVIGAVTGLSGSATVERPTGAAPLQLALHSEIARATSCGRYAAGTTEIFVADGRVLAAGTVDRDTDWVMLNAGEGSA